MKKLSIDEIHAHLLGIVKAFDKVCRNHSIPYYIIGGTLLGAIRHKGFIPWDDDIDVGVPMPYYDELMRHLESELKKPYSVCRYWNHKGCVSIFTKLEDSSTILEDPRLDIPLENQMGLNIDIFPLNYCYKGEKKAMKIRRLLKLEHKIFVESASGKKLKHYIKRLLQILYPYSHRHIQDKLYKMMMSINEGDTLTNLFGVYNEREFMPVEYYGNPVEYLFEDTTLLGPKNSDAYLKQIYGDYMQLPPEDKRQMHVDNVYLRES